MSPRHDEAKGTGKPTPAEAMLMNHDETAPKPLQLACRQREERMTTEDVCRVSILLRVSNPPSRILYALRASLN